MSSDETHAHTTLEDTYCTFCCSCIGTIPIGFVHKWLVRTPENKEPTSEDLLSLLLNVLGRNTRTHNARTHTEDTYWTFCCSCIEAIPFGFVHKWLVRTPENKEPTRENLLSLLLKMSSDVSAVQKKHTRIGHIWSNIILSKTSIITWCIQTYA